MKRKLLAVMLVAAMTASLAGCGNQGAGNPSSTPDSAVNGGSQESQGTQGTEGEGSGDGQVTLRFASWALGTAEENNIERQMIAAFEESHPNIKIEIAEDITGSQWNDALATAAAGGSLPDVSLIATLPTAVSNGWALELSDLIEADSADWNMVPESLRESGMYNGKSYGLSLIHI